MAWSKPILFRWFSAMTNQDTPTCPDSGHAPDWSLDRGRARKWKQQRSSRRDCRALEEVRHHFRLHLISGYRSQREPSLEHQDGRSSRGRRRNGSRSHGRSRGRIRRRSHGWTCGFIKPDRVIYAAQVGTDTFDGIPAICRSCAGIACSMPQQADGGFITDRRSIAVVRGLQQADDRLTTAGLSNAMETSTGKDAVGRAKKVSEMKTTIAMADEKGRAGGIKNVEDKTFYFKDGFWTDSTFAPSTAPNPEVIEFGSKRYFDLAHSIPGISKYLSVGEQVILIYQGHTYKIVKTSNPTRS